eukprot:CAMPEP_0176452986 /NCGR_PEP_ID=MMETSP0127-20121128/28920_1 /TAXON_ID=938130 /ORGANISM="Platyophrya macrostoma, Strain WH" /LENGTH=71 /DNA_ID=CAMNT_0017841661 /DNA_START=11 /DNA_END=223 /DNA_ORIENTATION=-
MESEPPLYDESQKGIMKTGGTKPGMGKTKSIHWDERGIEEWDKQRGKVPKINESKTPYNNDMLADEEVESQ